MTSRRWRPPRGTTSPRSGEYTIAVQFLNEFYDPTIPDPDARSRRLIVDRIVLDGPLNPTPTPEPESRRRLITCQPDGGDAGRACARQVIGRLQQRLGANDNRKLQEYLTGVREFERRLEAFDEPLACEASGRPADPDDLKHRIRLMSDLIVLAFRCDLTRVVTFMLGNGGGNQSYPWLGFADGHHLLSHHMGDRDKQSRYTQICAWEMEELAYLLAQLQAVPEGDGFVLDNTLCYSSSDVEDGDTHSHLNLPILLAGGAGGSMTPGRHLVFEDGPPLSNLLLSMLHMFGVEVTEFGDDSTTPLEGLA